MSGNSICIKNPQQLTPNQLLVVQLLATEILFEPAFTKFRKSFTLQGLNEKGVVESIDQLKPDDHNSFQFAERIAYAAVHIVRDINHFSDLSDDTKRQSCKKACAQMLMNHHISAWQATVQQQKGQDFSPFAYEVMLASRKKMFSR